MASESDRLKTLREALKKHREALDALEEALLAELEGRNGQNGQELLSIQDLCRELGMGRSWVYKRVRSGEIPHLQLGHTIKVRRKDLEEYLESQRRPRIQE